MENNEILLTKDGYEELKNELDELKGTARKEIAEKIKVALSFGDISENAEYDEAKNEQASIEARIAKLEEMLKNVKIIEKSKKKSVVSVGSTVKVLDVEFEEEMEFHIVGSAEADPFKGRISNVSPLGAALIGKKVNDKVDVPSPNGDNIKYEIISIQ